MAQITKHDPPDRSASVDSRLARWLESPLLPSVVPRLPPETLHQLVLHAGLHAATDLVTSATPAQLTALLDIDLWPSKAGHDHQLDIERFGEWLDVLADIDPAVAADTVAALDPHLIVTGLSRYIRVFDPGIFEPVAQSDDEAPDRHGAMREGDSIGAGDAGPSRLECHVGGFLVRARRSASWDAAIALLNSLERAHAGYLETLMRGCRRLSNSRAEDDGLDNLLSAPDQQLHDVASAREGRRSQQGYATPADARAFLQMARHPGNTKAARPGAPASAAGRNPIVAAYFRAADETDESSEAPPATAHTRHAGSRLEPTGETARAIQTPSTEISESVDEIANILADAGVAPRRPRLLLEDASEDGAPTRLAHLRRLMTQLRDRDEAAYFVNQRELAFLANVLIAGCSIQSRAFTTQEAADAAAATCNLGLEHWPQARSTGTNTRGPQVTSAHQTAEFTVEHDLVTAFEVGWSILHKDVSLFAATRLAAILGDLGHDDRDIRRGCNALRRALLKQRAAGTPWQARQAAEVLNLIDATAWIAVIGVLDECPVVPAALAAAVEGSATRVSPTTFDFISTRRQIDDIHAFLFKLPDLLSP